MSLVVDRRVGTTPSCSALLIKVVGDAMREQGVELPPGLPGVEASAGEPVDPTQRCPLSHYDELWRLALARNPDPMLGVLLAASVRAELFDAVGYYIKLSPTLGEAMGRLVRYASSLSEAFVCDLRMGEEQAVFEFEPLLGLSCSPQSLDFILGSVARLAIRQTGVEVKPREVRFTYAKPPHAERLAQAFGAPVVFGATANALVFDRAHLSLPSVEHDPVLADILERQARLWLSQGAAGDSLLSQVQTAIEGRLPDGAIGARDVASALAMSERTLRRRLSEVGASYQGVLDEVRFRLARRYLRTSAMDISEIAYQLGFSDASGFTRAFRRWAGVTAMEFRRSG